MGKHFFYCALISRPHVFTHALSLEETLFVAVLPFRLLYNKSHSSSVVAISSRSVWLSCFIDYLSHAENARLLLHTRISDLLLPSERYWSHFFSLAVIWECFNCIWMLAIEVSCSASGLFLCEGCSVCMYIYIYMCVCMYVCMHVCMRACMFVCIYVCMYVCMHICIMYV